GGNASGRGNRHRHHSPELISPGSSRKNRVRAPSGVRQRQASAWNAGKRGSRGTGGVRAGGLGLMRSHRMRAVTVQKRCRALTAGLLLGTCLSPLGSGSAWAVDVANETALRNAIFAANSGGDSNINVTANITLTQSLPMITASVTVTGNGNTLDANN